MPKSTTTAAEKAQAALDAANTRVEKKQSQYDTSKALTERLLNELTDAKQLAEFAAKHPALAVGHGSGNDAALDQGDVKDDGTDEDPFA